VAYTADKPKIALDTNLLRTSVPGWGVDLDPKRRPGVPRERFDPQGTGAHWVFPERQVATYRREKTTEHRFLTPVFGTVCPPKGISGLIRRLAYTFSEGRLAHWTLLVFADRVDVIESTVGALLRGHPDNPFAEMGLKSEITSHGLRARLGRGRADVKHLPIDVLRFAGSSVLTVATLLAIARRVQSSSLLGLRRRRRSWVARSMQLDQAAVAPALGVGLGLLAALGTLLLVQRKRRRIATPRLVELPYPGVPVP
jgi:hypothetical protein